MLALSAGQDAERPKNRNRLRGRREYLLTDVGRYLAPDGPYTMAREWGKLAHKGFNYSDVIRSKPLPPFAQQYLDMVEMAVVGSLYPEIGECHPDRTLPTSTPLQHSECIVSSGRIVGSFDARRRLMGYDWPTVRASCHRRLSFDASDIFAKNTHARATRT